MQGVPTYPNMFDPSQLVNKYSDWNDVKYQMSMMGTPTDAMGNPITPPPGVTLSGPWDYANNRPNNNYYGYIQTLANPAKVVTPGIAPAQQNNTLAPYGNIASIINAIRAPGAQNAPGYTPPPANPSIPWSGAGGVPGVSLGGGSSNVFGGGGAGGMGGNFLNALQALQGQPGIGGSLGGK